MGNGTTTGMQDARWDRGNRVQNGEWNWDRDTSHKIGTRIGTRSQEQGHWHRIVGEDAG